MFDYMLYIIQLRISIENFQKTEGFSKLSIWENTIEFKIFVKSKKFPRKLRAI